MNFVRGFFTGILSSILTIALIALGTLITLNLTLLNPDFVISELDKLDAYSIAVEQLRGQLPQEEPYMAEILDETITELEPWVEEQAPGVIYAAYAYLKGEEELNIVIPLEEVRTCLKENVEQAVLESPPPELEGASPSEIEAFLSEAYAGIDDQIPQQLEITEAYLTSLSPEMAAQVQEARQIVGYIESGYKWLIGAALLLVLLIALLQWWHIKPITRYVGISAITAGVVSLIGAMLLLAAENFVLGKIPLDIPPEVMAVLPQLVSDLTAPLRIYGIALLLAGTGLVVLSVKLKPPSQEETPR
jgi:hypothetical protein